VQKPAVDIADFAQALTERGRVWVRQARSVEKPDHQHRRLLRALLKATTPPPRSVVNSPVSFNHLVGAGEQCGRNRQVAGHQLGTFITFIGSKNANENNNALSILSQSIRLWSVVLQSGSHFIRG